ncbi:MAG TPA: GspH/FimT family pseudopilin [Aliidongia sp.]|nr:GspH/FimT family pseudopilin [Aliidongia sp.]
MTWPADRRQSGFTLIEMIIVLAILGLALALIVGRGPLRSETLNARETAGELAAALRETRGKAIAENRPVSFTLDIKNQLYRIADGRPVRLPRNYQLTLMTTTGEVRDENEGGIRFEPDGSSTGGRIVLTQGARKIQVGVDWLTGRVSIVNAP